MFHNSVDGIGFTFHLEYIILIAVSTEAGHARPLYASRQTKTGATAVPQPVLHCSTEGQHLVAVDAH